MVFLRWIDGHRFHQKRITTTILPRTEELPILVQSFDSQNLPSSNRDLAAIEHLVELLEDSRICWNRVEQVNGSLGPGIGSDLPDKMVIGDIGIDEFWIGEISCCNQNIMGQDGGIIQPDRCGMPDQPGKTRIANFLINDLPGVVVGLDCLEVYKKLKIKKLRKMATRITTGGRLRTIPIG